MSLKHDETFSAGYLEWAKPWNVMAFKPLLPKTEYMRLPIPDYSEIQKPESTYEGIPVPGCPQPMETYARKA